MSVSYDFKGKVALITGGGSGMGLATVKAFCAAGAAVALVDVNESTVQKETEALKASGNNILGIACDVSNEEQVAATVAVLWLCSSGSTFVIGQALAVDGGFTVH